MKCLFFHLPLHIAFRLLTRFILTPLELRPFHIPFQFGIPILKSLTMHFFNVCL